MANYRFSSLEDGDAIFFDPQTDVLFFDDCFVTPGSLAILACPASVVLATSNQSIRLVGVTVDLLSSRNIRFPGYDLTDTELLSAPFAH